MLATRPVHSLTSLGLPQALDSFVGSTLELVVHSVETLRDRLSKLGSWRSVDRTPAM